MGPTLILSLAMALPIGGGHGECQSCTSAASSCQSCDQCCQHGCLIGCGFWTRHGLPRPFKAPGNMYQRTPYQAEGAYYYFRPYNYMQIPVQQAEAVSFGASPGLPYANDIFEQVYRSFELQSVEEVLPMTNEPPAPFEPPALPQPAARPMPVPPAPPAPPIIP